MYEPGPLPSDAPAWMRRELLSIAESQRREVPFIQLVMLYAEPVRPREGFVALADGTEWDPGSGAGVYCYYGGAWNKLG